MVPAARSRGSYTPQARLTHQVLEGKLAPGLVPLPQLAVYRVTVLTGLGLLTWLLSLLLLRLGGSILSLVLPPWVVAGLALVGTCGVVGRLEHGGCDRAIPNHRVWWRRLVSRRWAVVY